MSPQETAELLRQRLAPYVPEYETVLADNLRLLADRYERDPARHFIDTKLNLVTGEDFPADAPPLSIYGSGVVYSWVQGRGLEAVAGHLEWLPRAQTLSEEAKADLGARLEKMLREVAENMEAIRAKNGGRMFFMLTTEGEPLEVGPGGKLKRVKGIPGQANMSDLFYAKGLAAAARRLGREAWAAEADACLLRCTAAIEADEFVTDQQPMDSKNKVVHVPGKTCHGPRMVAIEGLGSRIAAGGGAEWAAAGEKLVRFVVAKHVNLGKFADLENWDFVECVDAEGRPWNEGGAVLCDPGHALEFIGNASGFALAVRRAGLEGESFERLMGHCREVFPAVFRHVFRLGFDERLGGMRKAVDLIERMPLNSDMPWWCLPETMRAAVRLATMFPEQDPSPLLDIYEKCHRAFMDKYVNPKAYHMPVQTRNAQGEPSESIPAVPDADPCYHTGLSLLGAMELVLEG